MYICTDEIYSIIQGQTPLMFAAEGGHYDIVALLKERGANVNMNNNVS